MENHSLNSPSLDTRLLLEAELKRRQSKNASYSLRAFARQLELSPSYLCEILKGKKNATEQTFKRIKERIETTAV